MITYDKNKDPNYLSFSNKADLHSKKSFFYEEVVEKSRGMDIEKTFQALILKKRDRPFDWYKFLELDKSYASKIRRGLIIPPRWLRIRIAKYFDVDTSVLWDFPEIIQADKLNQSKKEVGS